MAIVIGITGMDLNRQEIEALTDAVTKGVEACEPEGGQAFVVIIPPLKKTNRSVTMDDRITYFVHIQAGRSNAQKKELVEHLFSATTGTTGFRGDYKVITYIEDQPAECTGINGAMLLEE